MKKVLALVLALALCLTAFAAFADGVAKEDIKLSSCCTTKTPPMT